MVEQINHPLNLEIREVKFGMSILSRSVPRLINEKSGIFRIISPVRKRKGTISLWGIGPNGNEVQYEWQRRDLSKDEQKSLLSLQRGDIIESQHAINMDESRVRLQSANDIHPHFLPRWGQIN